MFILPSSPPGQLGPSPSRPSRPSRRAGETAAAAPPPPPLHLHLVIWQMLLSKATYNWGIHKAIHLEEAIRQRKCS